MAMNFFTVLDKIWKDEPISDSELETLLQWFVSNDGRSQFEHEVENRWNVYRNDEGIEYDDILRKIHARKDMRLGVKRKALVRRNRWIAAAVVAVVAASAVYLSRSTDAAWPVNTSYHGAFGHGNKAVLMLGDGEIVAVDDYLNWAIEDGGSVARVVDGEITYEETCTEDVVVYHEITIPVGGEYKLILSDGTEIWLNSDTKLRYPNRFSSSERRVILSGEAMFDVAADSSKPFIVETEGQSVSVLGTQFNISAYADDDVVFTTLAEGSVVVKAADGRATLLVPGQQSMVDKADGSLTIKEVDPDRVLAWTHGYIVIDGHTLEQVMQKLMRWYDIEYKIDRDVPRDIVFRGVIPKYDLAGTLEKIEMISNLKLRLNGNTITVKP